MKASQCSFEQMQQNALTNRFLGETNSFMQVEYGLNELKACWFGFVDTSDVYELDFKSRKHICAEFANALVDYIEFLKPAPNPLGS